ncbi:hypothetical protein ACLOJK_023035 [Asimina triloba]
MPVARRKMVLELYFDGFVHGDGFCHGSGAGPLVDADLLPRTAGRLLKMGTPSWCDRPALDMELLVDDGCGSWDRGLLPPKSESGSLIRWMGKMGDAAGDRAEEGAAIVGGDGSA